MIKTFQLNVSCELNDLTKSIRILGTMNDKVNSELLQPLESDEFLPPIRRWTKFTGLLLVGTFGAALALAATIKYNITVKAVGMVRPAVESQIVEAAAQGRLKSLEVRENQLVRAGDVIARIDDMTLRLQKKRSENYITLLKTELAQIDSQVNSGNSVNFPWLTLRLQTYRKVQDQLTRAQKDLAQINQMLENTTIRTPVDGKILKLNIHNIGQPVYVGSTIAQIVPGDVPLIVQTRVAVQDIAQVVIGQPVQLRVSAYPYPDYGTLEGQVVAIAPDAVTPLNNADGSAPYYEVIIQPENNFLVKDDQQYSLQPGMEVTADIISNYDTVLGFIIRKVRLSTNL